MDILSDLEFCRHFKLRSLSISVQFRQKLNQAINTKALLDILSSRRLVKKSAKPAMLWYTLRVYVYVIG